MNKIILAALTMSLSASVAHSQSPIDTRSTDRAITAHSGYSPGTIGAMDEASLGIATNAADVALQQGGASAGYSPGTVGATPGR